MLRSRLLVLIFLSLAFAPLGTAKPATDDAQKRRVETALERIDKYRDRAAARHFDDLAKVGTEDAFKGLKKAVKWLREERAVSAAYRAFAHFKGVPGIDQKAIDYLAKEALGTRRRDSAPVAAATLGEFGDMALPAAELVASKVTTPQVRWAAIRPFLDTMTRGSREEMLVLLLSAGRPALDDEIKDVEKALKRFKGGLFGEMMLEAMVKRKTDSTMRILLMERMKSNDNEEYGDALIECLGLRDPKAQRRAIEILAERPDVDKAKVRLWSLLEAKDPQLRLVAIEGLARMSGDDAKWRKRLGVLSRDSEPLSRRGAARALAYQPVADAATALHAMLEDEDWRVRLEVVRQLGEVRDLRSISILVARMPTETGRLRRDIARALRALSGEDHGYSPDRWSSWWDGEKDGYALLTSEAAAARIAKLDSSRADSQSVATFYGLPVLSNRVAFVFDTSGSMNIRTILQSDDFPSDSDVPNTAMEYARHELKKLMQRLPDGAYCNVIFFSDKLDPWKRKLTELTPKSRKKALKFVDKKMATGGTALYDGLIEAFEDNEVDTIYILSDGLPSAGELIDPQEIRAAIAELNVTREVEIHGVDLSQASLLSALASTVPLVRWLAEDSGGRYVAPGFKLKGLPERK